MYTICEQLNISVLTHPLGNVNGFLQYYKEQDVYLIHVNNKLEEKDFTIAHELGHYFLHKTLNTFRISNCSTALEDKLEHQADIFATELLLTDEIINAYPQIQSWSLEQAATFYKLPVTAIQYKYSQMQLLSKKRTENRSNNYFNLAF